MTLGSNMRAEMEPLACTAQLPCFVALTPVREPPNLPAIMRAPSLIPCSPLTAALIHTVAGLFCALFFESGHDLGLHRGPLLEPRAGLYALRGLGHVGGSEVDLRARSMDRHKLVWSACRRVARVRERRELHLSVWGVACA